MRGHVVMDHPANRDALGLVKTFAARKSVKFEDFRSEWLKCKFFYIHCVGKDSLAKVGVVEGVFGTMVDVFSIEQEDIYDRLGALYLCYSLYSTQLVADSIKIRLCCRSFEAVQRLHRELRSKGIFDGDYVLCKLKSFSAFLVCATQKKKCLGYQSELANAEAVTISDNTSVHSESVFMTSLVKCQKLQHNYDKIKESLSDHLPPHLVLKCTVFDELSSGEKIANIKLGEVCPSPDQEGPSEGESSRSAILRRQYRSTPQAIEKLK